MIYIVKEKRTSIVEYEIEAVSEEAAKHLNGEIISETEIDNYSESLISCKELA